MLLSREGIRVHLVDSEPQTSLTFAFGLAAPKGLLYEAICQRGSLPVATPSDNLSISPSSIDFSQGETQFTAEAGRPGLSVLGAMSTNCITAA
jgi:hypothetical protein